MLRRTLWIMLLAIGLGNASGCCSWSSCGCGGGCPLEHAFSGDCRGGGTYYSDCGCGELYIDDWHSSPPRCEPCDQCANWTGPGVPPPCCVLPPRAGSIMPVHGVADGSADGSYYDDDTASNAKPHSITRR